MVENDLFLHKKIASFFVQMVAKYRENHYFSIGNQPLNKFKEQ